MTKQSPPFLRETHGKPGEFLEERPSGAPPLATRYLGKLQITGKKQHSADSFAARPLACRPLCLEDESMSFS